MILDASGVPVVIDLWVESIYYRDAELELSRREEAIPQPDDPPPGPFSPADPGIAAVDWISVDENGYLVAQAADIALLAELHEEARTSDLLQVKSPTTKPTKPSRPSGTRSRIKNAANTPTYAEQLTSAVHARPAALNYPHRSP